MGKFTSRQDQEYNKFEESVNLPTVRTFEISQLVPKEFDSIKLTYTGSDITKVEYFTDGVSGTVVATLTLVWTSGNLISVERT